MEEIFQSLVESINLDIGLEFDNILSSKLLEKIAEIVQVQVSKSEMRIKKEVTYTFRDELNSACRELLEAQSDTENLKSELSDLEYKIESLEQEIEDVKKEKDEYESQLKQAA